MKRSTVLAILMAAAWCTGSAYGEATLAVNATAALAGSFGLEVRMDGAAGGQAYVQDGTPNFEGNFRSLFLFRPKSTSPGPNGFTCANAGDCVHSIHTLHSSTQAEPVLRVEFIHRTTGVPGQQRVRLACWDDTTGGYRRTGAITLGTAPSTTTKQLEVQWGAGAGTGFCRLKRVDTGTEVFFTNLDNDGHNVKRARLGVISGIDATATGDHHFDAYESYR